MSKKPLTGRPVKPGDTIGVIALAAASEEDRFKRGIANLESRGYKTKIALCPWEDYGKNRHLFASDEPKRRADAFNELMGDESVAAVISARGGYGSAEVLPFIDFDAVARASKTFVGFSDTTAIALACYQRAGIISLHGPSIESAFSKADEKQEAAASSAVLIASLEGRCSDPFSAKILQPLSKAGNIEGPLTGGNLSIVTSLMGTPWEPRIEGHIFFFEEIAEKPYRVHRMLVQLKLAGKLSNLKGVVVGSLRECEDPKGNGPTVLEALTDIFKDASYPVFMGAPFGHELTNCTLPIGGFAEIRSNRLMLKPN